MVASAMCTVIFADSVTLTQMRVDITLILLGIVSTDVESTWQSCMVMVWYVYQELTECVLLGRIGLNIKQPLWTSVPWEEWNVWVCERQSVKGTGQSAAAMAKACPLQGTSAPAPLSALNLTLFPSAKGVENPLICILVVNIHQWPNTWLWCKPNCGLQAGFELFALCPMLAPELQQSYLHVYNQFHSGYALF